MQLKKMKADEVAKLAAAAANNDLSPFRKPVRKQSMCTVMPTAHAQDRG